MKITMYELLGMVKDGKAPSKIKYNDYEYRYHDKKHGYCRSGYDCTYICLNTDYCLFNILNDEVEIIEEEKKIPERVPNAEVFEVPKLNNMELSNIALTNKEDIKLIKETLKQFLDYFKSKGDE